MLQRCLPPMPLQLWGGTRHFKVWQMSTPLNRLRRFPLQGTTPAARQSRLRGAPGRGCASRTSPEWLVRCAHIARVGVASFLTPHFSQGHGTPCHYAKPPHSSHLTSHHGQPQGLPLHPHSSLLTPTTTSLLTPTTSLLTPTTSLLTPTTSLLTPTTSLLTPHPSAS